MTPEQYRYISTKNSPADPIDITHEQALWLLCGLGLAGEGGEVADILKKHVFHGKALDTAHLFEEVGDVLWYLDRLCWLMGWTLEEVMQANVAKLRKRYPGGFKKVGQP